MLACTTSVSFWHSYWPTWSCACTVSTILSLAFDSLELTITNLPYLLCCYLLLLLPVLKQLIMFLFAAAVTLLCIVLYGILHKHKLWYERSPWQSSGSLVRRPAGRLLQWLLVYYPVPVSIPSLSACTTAQALLDVAFYGKITGSLLVQARFSIDAW